MPSSIENQAAPPPSTSNVSGAVMGCSVPLGVEMTTFLPVYQLIYGDATLRSIMLYPWESQPTSRKNRQNRNPATSSWFSYFQGSSRQLHHLPQYCIKWINRTCWRPLFVNEQLQVTSHVGRDIFQAHLVLPLNCRYYRSREMKIVHRLPLKIKFFLFSFYYKNQILPSWLPLAKKQLSVVG